MPTGCNNTISVVEWNELDRKLAAYYWRMEIGHMLSCGGGYKGRMRELKASLRDCACCFVLCVSCCVPLPQGLFP